MELDYSDLMKMVETTPSSSQNLEYLKSKDVVLKPKEECKGPGYFEPEPGEYAPKGSLWNNPSVNKIRDNMTPEQRQYFENQKNMYDYDYKFADVDAELKELVEYAQTGLKSGLNPYDLTDDEKDALSEVLGPSWFRRYGFTEEEVYGSED